MKINKWTLLEKIKGSRKWLAKCECGNVCEVYKSNITQGKSKQCVKCQAKQYSQTTKLRTHGLSKKHYKLYNVWSGIKRRCYNPRQKSFKDYGAKGIRMCDEWINDFKTFCEWSLNKGYKEGLEIDRINSKGNYEPFNCRFITKQENTTKANKGLKRTQAQLRTNSIARLKISEDTYFEILEKCLSGDYKSKELSDMYNIERHTFTRMLKRENIKPNWRLGNFTKEQVVEIRKNSKTMTIPELVNKYKSNHETIGCILNKRGTYGKEYYL